MATSGRLNKFDTRGREMVRCELCGRYFHALTVHVSKHGTNVAEYKTRFPGSPLLSDYAKQQIRAARKRAVAATAAVTAVAVATPTESEPEVEVPETKMEDGTLHFGVASLKIREVSEDDQPFVPAHDENFQLDDGTLESAALAIQDGDNILNVGPTGCGKTAFWCELAALVNHPVRRLNLNGDVRAADFVGEKVVEVDPASGQAVVMWRDGILPQAMKSGHWLLLDELDAAPPPILFVLQAVLEKGGKLVIAGNSGEVVEAHPDFRVIATANTIGRGDDTGLYTGTQILNEAFLDRFGTVLVWTYADKNAEVKILVDKTKIDRRTAEKMVQCAEFVREAFGREECACTFSTRRLLSWANKTVRLRGAHWRAAEQTVFSKLTSDDRKFVEGVVQRVLTRPEHS